MAAQEAYLVLDIGTGNVRSAIVNKTGSVLGVARADIRYYRDELYPESIYFKPGELLQQLRNLTQDALKQAGAVQLLAVTSTSQREGIVLIDKNNKATMGLPNIDHRGREWQDIVGDKSRIYSLSGRYPTSLFSAYKLVGIREKRAEEWDNLSWFTSISDWAAWELCGMAVYEHSQASETLLYDVAAGQWSSELCSLFSFSSTLLPPLCQSGTILGPVRTELADSWGITPGMHVIAGGGDTQMAIKSSNPMTGDVIVVSGTTTPVVKLEAKYITDPEQRTWTSRDIAQHRFVFEANAGVTGLNYQRLKEVFYPNEGYDVIERELSENKYTRCRATLGSLVAGEKMPVLQGGFVFPVPVTHELTRATFVWATLQDIAFSIAANYEVLADLSAHETGYLWACGGGLQSRTLRQLLANITGREIRVREGFEQASVVGAAILCNEALGLDDEFNGGATERVQPEPGSHETIRSQFHQWRKQRDLFRNPVNTI